MKRELDKTVEVAGSHPFTLCHNSLRSDYPIDDIVKRIRVLQPAQGSTLLFTGSVLDAAGSGPVDELISAEIYAP